MPVSTSDGKSFDSETDYWYDKLFNEPHRQFDATLEPHKTEYLSHHSDLHHDQIVWPTDAKGIEFLQAVNESARKYGDGGMAAMSNLNGEINNG